jgi:hypothetical protein
MSSITRLIFIPLLVVPVPVPVLYDQSPTRCGPRIALIPFSGPYRAWSMFLTSIIVSQSLSWHLECVILTCLATSGSLAYRSTPIPRSQVPVPVTINRSPLHNIKVYCTFFSTYRYRYCTVEDFRMYDIGCSTV